MKFPRRSTGIVSGLKPHFKRLVIETAADDEYFFRVKMRLAAEGGCICARKKTGQFRVLVRLFINAQSQFLG